MNIGIIGCGSIAKKLVEFQLEDKLEVNIAYFYDIDHESAVKLGKKADAIATEDINDLIENCDLIMEAASQGAVRALMPNIIDHGCDVVIMSVGALMDEEFRSQLEQKAENSGSKIHLPTGAITGIDTVKAATLGEITSISLTTRKPPKSLSVEVEGTDEVVLFEGKASDAVNEFPKNINVSSTLSLASGINVDVKIIADPKIENNTHEIHLKGTFGELTTITSNVSSPENPKTSMLAAFSAASLLNKLSKTIQVGS